MNKKNLVGQRFGRLTVLSDSDMRSTDGSIKWLCQCDCGSRIYVNTTSLTSGNTQSCGCLHAERTRKATKKYNSFKFDNDVCYGTDSKGLVFIIDAEDYNKVKDICWVVSEDGRVSGRYNGKNVRLHRHILNAPTGTIVDHINHNPSDNRKKNLRYVTKSQNAMNRPSSGITKSSNGKYYARIGKDYKGIYLGCFNSFDEARKARLNAEEKYFGEYAYKGGEVNE